MRSWAALCASCSQGGYRAGLDAVLLAAAAPLRAGRRQQVLDVGAGVGVVGLWPWPSAPRTAHVTLLERDPGQAELCRRNILGNGLTARARVLVERSTGRLASGRNCSDWLRASTTCWPIRHTSAKARARPRPRPLKAAANAMRPDGLRVGCASWPPWRCPAVRPP